MLPIFLLKHKSLLVVPSIKFLKRKLYNHCRRGNLLLAATHGLHLERFIEDINNTSTNLLQELENWVNGEDMTEVSSNLQDTMTKYDSYLEETLNGKMGKTAQFLITYTKAVRLIQLMPVGS